jgi:hypothetical protein
MNFATSPATDPVTTDAFQQLTDAAIFFTTRGLRSAHTGLEAARGNQVLTD